MSIFHRVTHMRSGVVILEQMCWNGHLNCAKMPLYPVGACGVIMLFHESLSVSFPSCGSYFVSVRCILFIRLSNEYFTLSALSFLCFFALPTQAVRDCVSKTMCGHNCSRLKPWNSQSRSSLVSSTCGNGYPMLLK